MSDVFMDMHRSHRRWRNTPSTSATTMTTTSESPSSTEHANDHIFSHQHKSSTAVGNANYNLSDVKEDKSVKDNNFGDANDDSFENILSLKLRKPTHWKWELSTSKSCSNIALPRILLYDHKGQLLADAKGDRERIYKQEEKPKSDKSTKRAHQSKQQHVQCPQRSATTNLTHSVRKALENEFNGLQIQEATPSPEPYSPISISSHRSRKAVDFFTTDLPDYGLSRRSSSLKGVRFNVVHNKEQSVYESQIPEFLPTPPSTTTPTSSSSGPREKRKYRRSQSSSRSSGHSESILERFSYQKGRFSSPEYTEENEVQQAPRYFLRTCNAGTLVVKEDSFCQHPKRRRRLIKNRSTESLKSKRKPLPLSSSIRKQSDCSSPTPSDSSHSIAQQPTCPHLADANISSASDERPTKNENEGNLRKNAQARNPTKDLNYSTDIQHNGKVR